MFAANNKISNRQLQMLLILDVFGTGVIVLPRRAAEYAGQNGYWLMAAALLPVLAYAYIITTAGRLFPGESFLDYSCKILSKPAGIVLGILLLAKIWINLGLELRLFGEILRQTILHNTPFWAIAVTMLLTGAYAAVNGYETRARLAEILFFVVFVPFIFVFALGLRDVDWSNAAPAQGIEASRFTEGIFRIGYAFSGLELVLLVHPYAAKPRQVRRSVLQAVLIIGLLMFIIVVITTARFGANDLQNQMWPTLEMMNMIKLPGSFIERQDALIMTFWIISVFAITNAGLFFSAVLMRDLLSKTHSKASAAHDKNRLSRLVLISAPVVFVVACLPRDIMQIYGLLDWMFLTFGTAFFIVVPVLLLLVAKGRGFGGRYEK